MFLFVLCIGCGKSETFYHEHVKRKLRSLWLVDHVVPVQELSVFEGLALNVYNRGSWFEEEEESMKLRNPSPDDNMAGWLLAD